jgi:hypothetical protein
MFGTAFVAFGAMLGAHAAWRIADIAAFANDGSQPVRHYFRIVDFRESKRRFYAEIEPYRDAGRTELPVSSEDYARIQAADEPHSASIYCYPVYAQTAGAVVRIFKPRVANDLQQNIVPCPARTDDHWER